MQNSVASHLDLIRSGKTWDCQACIESPLHGMYRWNVWTVFRDVLTSNLQQVTVVAYTNDWNPFDWFHSYKFRAHSNHVLRTIRQFQLGNLSFSKVRLYIIEEFFDFIHLHNYSHALKTLCRLSKTLHINFSVTLYNWYTVNRGRFNFFVMRLTTLLHTDHIPLHSKAKYSSVLSILTGCYMRNAPTDLASISLLHFALELYYNSFSTSDNCKVRRLLDWFANLVINLSCKWSIVKLTSLICQIVGSSKNPKIFKRAFAWRSSKLTGIFNKE